MTDRNQINDKPEYKKSFTSCSSKVIFIINIRCDMCLKVVNHMSLYSFKIFISFLYALLSIKPTNLDILQIAKRVELSTY